METDASEILVVFSGENPCMSMGEVEGLARFLGGPMGAPPGPFLKEDFVASIPGVPDAHAAGAFLSQRLALSRFVVKKWVETDTHGLMRSAGDHVGALLDDLSCVIAEHSDVSVSSIKKRRFSVEVKKVPGGVWVDIEREARKEFFDGLKRSLGRTLKKMGGTVDLREPEVRVVVLVGQRLYVGEVVGEVDRGSFEKRKVSNRPFFSPISIHPRYARAMLNMAAVREGDRVYDPMCGTGGVLLEGWLVGVEVWGSDCSQNMVDGTIMNLHHFLPQQVFEKAKDRVFLRDVRCPPPLDVAVRLPDVFDAVVTDPPYGRSTHVEGDPGEVLFSLFRDAAQRIKKGGRFVFILPSAPGEVEGGGGGFENHGSGVLERAGFRLLRRCVLHVHGSLSRVVYVYEKM